MGAFTRTLRAALLGALVGTLGACSTVRNPGEEISDLPPATLPQSLPGDHYVYDDGHIERVQAVSLGGTRWRIANGLGEYVLDADYTLPPSQWRGGGVVAKQLFTASNLSFWPLQAGNSNTIDSQMAVNQDGRTLTYEERWRCEVEGAQRLALAIGVTDTQLVTCTRRSSSGYNTHQQTWYHAPSLAHWVRKIDRTSGAWRHATQRDLVAYRQIPRSLSLAQATRHEVQLQQALETVATGQRYTWQTDAGSGKEVFSLRSELLVLDTFVSQQQLVCRHVTLADQAQPAQALTFCRSDAEWVLSVAG